MGGFDQEGVVRLMVGRSVDTLFPRERLRLGDSVLEVEGLSRDGVLKDISFKVVKVRYWLFGPRRGAVKDPRPLPLRP